jgi:hypothetical protein
MSFEEIFFWGNIFPLAQHRGRCLTNFLHFLRLEWLIKWCAEYFAKVPECLLVIVIFLLSLTDNVLTIPVFRLLE